MPLIGCLDLLLADIDQASARFSSSSDENSTSSKNGKKKSRHQTGFPIQNNSTINQKWRRNEAYELIPGLEIRSPDDKPNM